MEESQYKRIHEKIIKHASDKSSTDKQIQQLIDSDEEHKEFFDQVQQLLAPSQDSEAIDFFENEKEACKAEFRQIVEEDAEPEKSRNFKTIAIYASAVAAAVVLLLVVFNILEPAQEGIVYISETDTTEYFTPDGSLLLLKKASVVSFEENASVRTAHIERGEVFFQVKHETERPFSVNTSTCKVTVTGTSFNINASNPDSVIVSVFTGSVLVETKKEPVKSIALQKGEQSSFTANGSILPKTNLESDNSLFWKTGKLLFKNEKMYEVIETLSHAYGIEIKAEDPTLYDSHYAGTFNNMPIEVVMEILTTSFNTTFTKKGNTYIINQHEKCQ